MISYTFRPLTTWPRKRSAKRFRSPFTVSLGTAWRYLTRELEHLGVKDQAVIEASFREQDLTTDGSRPRSDAPVPAFPGVIISAHTRFGPMKWPCDACDRWQDNVRAIALSLEKLRGADRYGMTSSGEQYTGWKSLPGAIVTPATMTAVQAAIFIRKVGGFAGGPSSAGLLSDQSAFSRAWREAVKSLHPDANAGRALPEWHQLQQAKDILDQHFIRKGK